MADKSDLVFIGAAGLGLYFLSKNLSNITQPTGDLISTANDYLRIPYNVVTNPPTIYINGLSNEKGVDYSSQFNKGMQQFVNIPTFNMTSNSSNSSRQITKPTSVTSGNTIFTNPVSKVNKSIDLTSAQQMIELSKNPSLQNIATNIGNAVTYVQKTVQLTPKQNLGGILI